jgi:hypothetical protein
MQSKASTVKGYLAELPAERRAALETVRGVILKSLAKGFEEGMGYGMICYSVPHSRYPDGYHCKPEQALPFAGLASQKQYMSLYLCTQYASPGAEKRFRAAWDKAVRAGKAKKLDMGKSCIRFKKVEDLALDVIADSIRSQDVGEFIEFYERTMLSANKQAAAKRSSRDARRTKPVATKAPAKKVKSPSGRRATAARARA